MTSHYLNQWWPSLLTQLYLIWPWWVNRSVVKWLVLVLSLTDIYQDTCLQLLRLYNQLFYWPKSWHQKYNISYIVILTHIEIKVSADACPDSKVHGANMGPTWVLLAQVGPMWAPWTLLSGWIIDKPMRRHSINKLRLRQNGWHLADDIIKCIFLKKTFEFLLKSHWSLIPSVHLTICQHLLW